MGRSSGSFQARGEEVRRRLASCPILGARFVMIPVLTLLKCFGPQPEQEDAQDGGCSNARADHWVQGGNEWGGEA